MASMGHELRNPLTSILAVSEALHDGVYGPLNDAQRGSLLTIRQCVERQIDLIMDMIDLSRLETGPFQLVPAACGLDPVVERAVAIVRELAHSRAIRLSHEINPKGGKVMADGRRLRQIMIQMLTAGILSLPGDGQVRLSVSESARHGGLLLQAACTPGGLTASLVEEPRFDEGTAAYALKRMGQVRPMGLALLQEIVRLHGGAFASQETEGGGVCWSVSLPLGAGVPQVVPPAPPAGPEAAREGAVPLILLADDQAALVAIVSDYLCHKGFRVCTASNGREALELAEATQPDLVIMDVQMPGMDGIEAVGRLRKSGNPRVAQVPVMCLSGLAGPGDRDLCLAAGATAYLAKPFGVKELEAVIRDMVRQPAS